MSFVMINFIYIYKSITKKKKENKRRKGFKRSQIRLARIQKTFDTILMQHKLKLPVSPVIYRQQTLDEAGLLSICIPCPAFAQHSTQISSFLHHPSCSTAIQPVRFLFFFILFPIFSRMAAYKSGWYTRSPSTKGHFMKREEELSAFNR